MAGPQSAGGQTPMPMSKNMKKGMKMPKVKGKKKRKGQMMKGTM